MYPYLKELVEAQDFFRSGEVKRGSNNRVNSSKDIRSHYIQRCYKCGTVEGRLSLVAKLARALGGTNKQNNLHLLCDVCNKEHAKAIDIQFTLLKYRSYQLFLVDEYLSSYTFVTNTKKMSGADIKREILRQIKSRPYKYLRELMKAQYNFTHPGIIRGSSGTISKSRKNRIIKSVGKCEECGKKDSLTIDHKLCRALGGNNEDENIGVLCKLCNNVKGLWESVLLEYLCTEEGRQQMINDFAKLPELKIQTVVKQLNRVEKINRYRQAQINSDYICKLLKERGIV